MESGAGGGRAQRAQKPSISRVLPEKTEGIDSDVCRASVRSLCPGERAAAAGLSRHRATKKQLERNEQKRQKKPIFCHLGEFLYVRMNAILSVIVQRNFVYTLHFLPDLPPLAVGRQSIFEGWQIFSQGHKSSLPTFAKVTPT